MASITIAPNDSGTYSIYATVGKHSRTYQAPTLQAAQIRAERLCYLLDLKTSVIQHSNKPPDTSSSKPVHKPVRRKKK